MFGEVTGRTVRKFVKKSKHLFRKWDSWGVDCDFWHEQKKGGVTRLEILDSEEKLLYTIDMDEGTWADHKADFGHGMQYFIPRKYFKKNAVKE